MKENIMCAIAECKKLIQGLGAGKVKQEIKDLRQLVDAPRNSIGRDPNFMEREVSFGLQ